jgi:hypothetical protein
MFTRVDRVCRANFLTNFLSTRLNFNPKSTESEIDRPAGL